jgi:hypothetical protein
MAMALKFRPDSSIPDDERQDYTVRCGNMEIGRIYEVERSRPSGALVLDCPFDGRTH